jgi:hypothetical protein
MNPELRQEKETTREMPGNFLQAIGTHPDDELASARSLRESPAILMTQAL